jgi:predicted anti-sigma-YlaC factor YlaD
VGCHQYREALSAELDGEPPGVPAAALAGHLRDCAACRDWYGRAARVTRLARLAPADPMPDLAPLVLAALPAGPTGSGWVAAAPSADPAPGGPGWRRLAGAARAALVAVAFVQALLAWSGALTGQDDMATGHLAHEVGAWNLALAVAFLAAATRPRTADALVAPVGIFVAVLGVAAIGDAAAGDLAAGRLAGHLLVALGLGLLVVVGRSAPAQPGTPPVEETGPRERPTGPHVVPDLTAVPTIPFAQARGTGMEAGSAA